jgi:hypothetical protein
MGALGEFGLFLKPGGSGAPIVRAAGLDIPVNIRLKGRRVLNPFGNLPQLLIQQFPQDNVFSRILFKAKIPACPKAAFSCGRGKQDGRLPGNHDTVMTGRGDHFHTWYQGFAPIDFSPGRKIRLHSIPPFLHFCITDSEICSELGQFFGVGF